MLNKLRHILFLFPALLSVGFVSSDRNPEPDPNFRFPLSLPETLLSGTFGELRTNHFHSGIDIKTGGEIGKPLYAVQDGYVYRLKVSPWGFGKAVYLRHPDGNFTVYAHMNGFNEEIEDFVYRKQYAGKQYEQEIYLSEDRIPVKRGDLIGYSGNSGSSQGPHLHFEVRDPEERIMNPLHYYRGRVEDNIRPTVQEIAFEPMHAGARVNGSAEKLEVVPEGSKGVYRVPGVTEIVGPVGMEYRAFDLLNGAGNHCGINYARLYLDDTLIFEFVLDKFGFDEKKYINAHFDYAHDVRTGKQFEKAYLDNGNRLSCYRHMRNRGIIELDDPNVHHLRLELADGYNNTTVVRAMLRQAKKDEALPAELSFNGRPRLRSYMRRNTILLRMENPETRHLRGMEVVYMNGDKEMLKPSYLEGRSLVYLLPVGKFRLPETVTDPVTGQRQVFFFRKTLLPEKSNIVDYGELQAFFPYKCIFDTLQLEVKTIPGNPGMYSDIYEIGNDETPLFLPIVLNFKPRPGVDPRYLVVARRTRSGGWAYVGNEHKEDGSIFAQSSKFGAFCLRTDSVAPKIKALDFMDGGTVQPAQKGISLRITDNFSGVVSNRIVMTIDGEWVLAEYDAKTSSIRHNFRDRPSPGAHKVEVTVYDSANNRARESFTLYFR